VAQPGRRELEVKHSVTEEERRDQALALAYRYLGHRDRTVAEVRAHLRARGMAHKVGESVLAELSEQGYLDDAAYARRYVEDRRALDGWGAGRIERTLNDRGVAAELVEAALGGRGPGAELDAAVDLLHRRLKSAPADARARGRALGLLVRRGYELELAHDAVRRAERELPPR